jgi:membrane associated rhomboid family serine protease
MRTSPRRHAPFATVALVGAMAAAYALDAATRPRVGLGPEALPARFVLLGDGPAPWQLVTWAFVHADAGHLRANAAALLVFGAACERHLGARAFAAAALAACVTVAVVFVCVDGRDLYGASGLVAALAALAFALASTRDDAPWVRAVVGLAALVHAVTVDLGPWVCGAPGPGLRPHAIGYATGFALAFALAPARTGGAPPTA